ncbi:MAG: hypothetical protein K8S98_03605 [Planctomycetes bacterium]|nr:hypothetical protein [Planctomycetota bacterium]
METIASPTADRGARARGASSILISNGTPVLIGAALAFLLRVGSGLEPDYAPGPATTWVADRDADAVIGLDDELIETKRIEIESPIEVERRSDGATWVVSARDAHPLGPHDLVLYDREGGRSAAAVFGPVLDLERVGDDALVVERKDGNGRVVRVDSDGRSQVLLELATARCAAGCGSVVAVGTDDGAVWLVEASGPRAVFRRQRFGGLIGDLAPGPEPGTWWVLDIARAGRLGLLEPDLSSRWTVDTGLHALHLAPVRGLERVWLADTTEPVARRYGAGGVLELDVRDLPLGGLDRAAAFDDGGASLAAPGAVLRLDSAGRIRPGQGGFDFLVDVTR